MYFLGSFQVMVIIVENIELCLDLVFHDVFCDSQSILVILVHAGYLVLVRGYQRMARRDLPPGSETIAQLRIHAITGYHIP